MENAKKKGKKNERKKDFRAAETDRQGIKDGNVRRRRKTWGLPFWYKEKGKGR